MRTRINFILELVGTLSDEEAEEIKENIMEGRKRIRERMNNFINS